MSNTEIVKRMYKLFAEGKVEKIKELFSPQLKWYMMEGFPNGGQYTGIDAVFDNVFGYFKTNWIEWKAVSEQFYEVKSGVFVTGYYEGTFRDTGKYVKANFANYYKLKNDKIVEYHQWTDTALIVDATKNNFKK